MGYLGKKPADIDVDIADASISATELAADSVDSSELVDGSIDTSHIADNQVTLAKMAGLARGKIIYGDASGDPAALTVGSNGQVLTSDGTDISWGSDAKLTTEEVQDIAGAMFSSNTETGITATYQDGDGTIDLVVGTLNQDTTGTAATVTGAAQTNITSLGTLTTLTVDNVIVNGTTIGHTSDTDLITLADGVVTVAGELDATTLDISGNADIDGTLEADAITVNGSTLASIIAGTTVANATLAATTTVTDSTANTNFPVVFHNESNALLDDTGALRYNPSTGELLVPKLTVAGTTTTADTVTMEASNAIVFEGATADAHETTLSIVDPTGDHTQYLINQGGYIPVLAAATTTAITATPAELNLLDTAAANSVVNSKAVIYGSSGELAGTLSTAAQTNITSLGTLTTLTVDDITINGSTISDSGDLDFDVGGDITLDADGGDWIFKDGGTELARIYNDDNDITFKSTVSDKDIQFEVNDGSSFIYALKLDASDAGTAIFNHDIILGDNGVIGLGASNDLQIWHDGSNSHINNNYGVFYLDQHTNDGNLILRNDDGSGGLAEYIVLDGGGEKVKLKKATEVESSLEVEKAGDGNSPILHVIDTADTEVAWFEGRRAGDTGAYIAIRHNPSSQANSNRAGIKFQADDDAGNVTNYAQAKMYISDNTNGSEDSSLAFNTMKDGTDTEVMRLVGDKVGILDNAPSYVLDMNASSSASAFRIASGGSGKDVNCTISNGGTNTTDDTLFDLTTAGGAGDPKLRWSISGNENFEMGIDNSDSDMLKISQGTALGSTDIVTFTGGKQVFFGATAAVDGERFLFNHNGTCKLTIRCEENSSARDAVLSLHSYNTGSQNRINFLDGSGAGSGQGQIYYNHDGNSMYFHTAGSEVMILNSSGDLAIDGSYSSSDQRLKKNIQNYTYDINKFKSYTPRIFDWINPEEHGNRSQQIGFIAQEQELIDDRFIVTFETDADRKDTQLVDKVTKLDGDVKGVAKHSDFKQKDAMYISVIQQLITRLETAEAKIAVLEG